MVLHKTIDGMVSCAHWDDLCTTFLGEGRNRYDADYIVFTDGTDTFGQNGVTGAIDYGGPDDNGAVDGADEGAVIQACITALGSSGGLIYIKGGRYYIDAEIDISDRITLEGNYVPSAAEFADGKTILQLNYDGRMFDIVGTDRLTDQRHGICFKNIMFHGNAKVFRIIDAQYAHGVHLIDCSFYDATPAIYAHECWDWRLRNVHFYYCGNAANPVITVYNGAVDTSNHFHFLNCRWEDLAGRAFNSDSGGAGGRNHSFKFIGCKFEGHAPNTYGHIYGVLGYSVITACLFGVTGATENAINLGALGNNNKIGLCTFSYIDGADIVIASNRNSVIGCHFEESGATEHITISSGTGNIIRCNTKYDTVAIPLIADSGTTTRLPKINGDFTNYGGGSAGWTAPVINTSPGGIDIDANDEFAYARVTLPNDAQQVVRIKIWAYANILEADKMRLRIVAHGATDNEAWSGNAIDVANHPSESSNFAANDVIYWLIDASDDAQIGTLVAQDYIEILAIGEVAGGADCATDALFGGYEIEYV